MTLSNSSTPSVINDSSTLPGILQIPYTGLIRSDISPEIADALGLNDTYPGLLVVDVIPGSPAAKAGIRGANSTNLVEGELARLGGDIILQVDQNASIVKDDASFTDYLENERRAGDNLTLTIARNGKIGEIVLTLGALPSFLPYVDQEEGIAVKYPYDWTVSDSNLRQNDVIKFFSAEQNPELDLPTAAVIIKASPTEGLTLDELAVKETEGLNNTRLLDLKGTELSGLQAYESTFYEYGDDRTLKVNSIFTLNDDQFFRINFVCRSRIISELSTRDARNDKVFPIYR